MLDPIIWAILLLFVAAGLIVLEVFIPSGGLISVLAAVAVAGAIAVAFWGGPVRGVVVLVFCMIFVPVTIYAVVRIWPRTAIGRLILNEPPAAEDEILPDIDAKRLVGKFGKTKTKMMPSGEVKIDGLLYDAVSEGMAIEAGRVVKVVSARNNRPVVRLHEGELPPSEQEPVEAILDIDDDEELLARPIDDLGIEPLDDPLA